MKVPETFFSVNEEVWLFLLSCALGTALGAFYEIFRTIRTLFRHNTFLTAAEDVIFLAVWGTSLTAFASVCSHGQLRGYFVIGSMLGVLLYIALPGRIVSSVVKRTASAVRRAVSFILLPGKKCCVFIRRKARFKFVGNSKNIVNSIKKVEILLPNAHNLLYNKTENKKRKNVKNVVKKKKAT